MLTTIIVLLVIIVVLVLLPGLKLITDYEVGILTKRMFGRKMPQGQVVARMGQIGVQADTLMPGLYWRIPIIWKIQKTQVTEILPTEVGIVESIDGKSIPRGRLLGDEIDCNHFQDAKMFLDNGGMKGPQVAILRPGIYRINRYAFKVTKASITEVPGENIGVAIANDGLPLPSGYIVAPRPPEVPTKDCSDCQEPPVFPGRSGIPQQRRVQGSTTGHAPTWQILHQSAAFQGRPLHGRRSPARICGGPEIQRRHGAREGRGIPDTQCRRSGSGITGSAWKTTCRARTTGA